MNSSTRPAWTPAVIDAVRTAVRIDRPKVAIDVGLRAALGVALTLGIGEAAGHPVTGVTASIGALSGGFASHQGTYRSRALIVLIASAAMAVAAFAGGTIGHLLGPDIVVTSGLGFAAGILVSLGTPAMVVGIQAVVGLVVFSQFTLSASSAAVDAGFILAGGALQALLVVLVWPLQRFPAERSALSRAYASLARYCLAARSGTATLFDAADFDALGAVIRDPQPFGGVAAGAHQALVAQADRIRLELVALVRARERLIGREALVALDGLLTSASSLLDEVANVVADARGPVNLAQRRDELDIALGRLRATTEGIDSGRHAGVRLDPAPNDALARSEALAGQLRTVARLAVVAVDRHLGSDVAQSASVQSSARPPFEARAWVSERAAVVRSNLTLSSQAFRHPLRLAVTLGVAVGLSHFFVLAHRYWLPMTAMLVLRPDFTSTFARGLSRVAGTLIGAGLVTVVLAEAQPPHGWLIVMVVVLTFAATALVLANYAVFSICISSLVVTLLAFIGEPGLSTAGDRSMYTVLGAAVALAAYVVWPTWQATSLRQILADLVQVDGRYAGQVLGGWADPASVDRGALQRLRQQARLARSNAEAAVTRWLSEPEQSRGPDRQMVVRSMSAIRSCVQAILALHADLPDGGAGRPEAAVLATEIPQAMDAIASRLRAGMTQALPPLRSHQRELVNAQQDHSDAASLVLADESDFLVNSINTLGQLLGLLE